MFISSNFRTYKGLRIIQSSPLILQMWKQTLRGSIRTMAQGYRASSCKVWNQIQLFLLAPHWLQFYHQVLDVWLTSLPLLLHPRDQGNMEVRCPFSKLYSIETPRNDVNDRRSVSKSQMVLQQLLFISIHCFLTMWYLLANSTNWKSRIKYHFK